LARRDLICLAGEPKLGKSWVALDLAFSLCMCRKWLGAVALTGGPYRVLYVDEENNARLIGYRVRKLVIGNELLTEQVRCMGLCYVAESGINLDDQQSLDSLKATAAEHKPDLIILDSLIRFHRRDENSNTDLARLTGDILKPLAISCDAALLYLHHLAKPGKDRPADDLMHRVRGGGDLVAGVDQLWTLQRNSDGSMNLNHELTRWSGTAEALQVNLEDVSLGHGLRVEAVAAQADLTGQVEAIIKESPQGISRASISLSTGAEKRSLSRALCRLMKAGQVEKRKDTIDPRRVIYSWVGES
jgi:hypothetical protein